MKKQNIIPTNNEIVMKDNDFIISKTDARGIITYCNEIFMDIASYNEDELLGQNHNIIRHPDMPKIAFKLAWDLISSGKEFFGFVKNLTKNGDYYWVFANITPDYDQNGKIVGYTSVRRKPSKNAIEVIMPIYKKLIDIEKSSGIDSSSKFLFDFLAEKKLSYDELILSLQGN